jgi:hypothetical protein
VADVVRKLLVHAGKREFREALGRMDVELLR